MSLKNHMYQLGSRFFFTERLLELCGLASASCIGATTSSCSPSSSLTLSASTPRKLGRDLSRELLLTGIGNTREKSATDDRFTAAGEVGRGILERWGAAASAGGEVVNA